MEPGIRVAFDLAMDESPDCFGCSGNFPRAVITLIVMLASSNDALMSMGLYCNEFAN